MSLDKDKSKKQSDKNKSNGKSKKIPLSKLSNNKSKSSVEPKVNNQNLANEYSEMINNNPSEFIKLLDNAKVDLHSISPEQRKIVKKHRSKLMRKSMVSTLKAL